MVLKEVSGVKKLPQNHPMYIMGMERVVTPPKEEPDEEQPRTGDEFFDRSFDSDQRREIQLKNSRKMSRTAEEKNNLFMSSNDSHQSNSMREIVVNE